MPNKWLNQKGIEIKKQKYKLSNWSDYNKSLKNVIPPAKHAVLNIKSYAMRNRNILEIAAYGRMAWQKNRRYGRRNISELAIQRYKRMLGRSMHARKFERQQQALMIGCGILNKMTHLGMPKSFKTA